MFTDRSDAGAQLAEKLLQVAPPKPLVLALPRGGVPVALPVARALAAPLDLLLVRKIGVPGHSELAAGAVVDGAAHEVVFNTELLAAMGLRQSDFAEAIQGKLQEIEARRALWLGRRAPEPVRGRNVVVVDDGIATGATMRAALKALRNRGAAHVLLAVPVAAADTLAGLAPLAGRIVCLETPQPFYAVGAHYRDFRQVGDGEVLEMLRSIHNENGDER